MGRRRCIASRRAFYASVLRDPLFGAGQPDHVDHLTAFTVESFGGPDRFTRELGFAHLIAVHRGLAITEEQRLRFVELYMEAFDAAGMPADAAFRDAVRAHVEFGSLVAMQNSHAATGEQLPPLQEGPALDLGRRRPQLTGDQLRAGTAPIRSAA